LLEINFKRITPLVLLVTGPLLSMTIEIVQKYVPGRVSDLIDVALNSLGFLVVAIIVIRRPRWYAQKWTFEGFKNEHADDILEVASRMIIKSLETPQLTRGSLPPTSFFRFNATIFTTHQIWVVATHFYARGRWDAKMVIGRGYHAPTP